jgi:undecaprenyl-diphosphatase
VIENLEKVDQKLLIAINSMHSPLWDNIMWIVSNNFFIYPFIIALLIFFVRKKGQRYMAAAVLGIGLCVACADLSSELVKHSVKRYRPTHNLEVGPQLHIVNDYKGGQYTFFSSHASNTFSITTLLFLMTGNMIARKWRWLFFLVPLTIVYSRMYLGVHYPFDIFTGTMVGIFVGNVVDRILARWFIKQPAP